MARSTPSQTLRRAAHVALDTAVATIAMLLGVGLLPGSRWVHGYRKRTCVYPLNALIEGPRERGVMALWQGAAHVRCSHGELDLYDVLVDTILEVEARVGARTARPDWLMPAVAAAERERAARVARRLGRSLAERQLPPRGTSFRDGDRAADLAALEAPVATEAAFWHVVAAAVEGIASGTIHDRDLEANGVSWPPEVLKGVRATAAAVSYDALIEAMQPVLVAIAVRRAEALANKGAAPDGDVEDDAGSESGDGHDASAAGGADPAAGNAGAGADADSSAAGEPDDEEGSDNAPRAIEIDIATLERILAELEADDRGRVEIDYTAEGGVLVPVGPTADGDDEQQIIDRAVIIVPVTDLLWETVSRSNAHVLRPIADVISRHLAENEIGELERGTRSGRLDVRAIAAPPGAQAPPFMRRATPDDRSYDVVLVVDRSGSMVVETGSAEDPAVFGSTVGRRWHLALRLEVALVEALARLPGTRTAVVTYSGVPDLVKPLGAALGDAVKDAIVRTTVPDGCNDDTAALACAIAELAPSEADRKLLFFLTDGEFHSNALDVRRVLERCRSEDIELVFLTVGQSAEPIRAFVPAHLADEITETMIARVLTKHVARMLDLVVA